MYYVIYLVSMLLFLVGAACIRYFPLNFVPNQLLNFIDMPTFVFILIPCLLVLFCTKSFVHFGRSFLFMFGKKITVSKDCAHSVRAVIITAVISGAAHAIAVTVNILSCMNVDDPTFIGSNIHIILLSLLYPLVLCLILLPVLISIQKQEHISTIVLPHKAGKKK